MLKEMAGNEKGERIFNGFFEPPVEFPPSYRRIKSENPLLVRSRGDLMDLQKVNDAYATFVHKKGGSEVIISRRSNSISSKDETTLIQEASSLPGTPRSSTPGGNSTNATELDNSSQLSISLNYQSQRRLSGVTTPVAVGSDDDPESLKKSQLRVPSYTDRCLARSPLLAGVKVSEVSFSAALKARRQKSSEKRDSDSVLSDVSSTTNTTGSDLDTMTSISLKRKGPEVVFVGGTSKTVQQSQVDDQSNSSAGDYGETVSRMFVPLPPLRCLYYDSCDTVSNSDHAPITAIWDLSLRSGINDILPSLLNSITVPPPFPMSVPSPLQLFSRQQRSGRDTPATDESLSRPQSRLNLSEAAKEGESPLASINKIQTSTDSIPIATVRLLKPSEPLFDFQRNQKIADSILVAPSILSMLQSEAKAADAADAAALRRKRINSGIGAASVQRIVDAGLAAPPAGVVGEALTE
jgi:hypothetical protein